MTWKIVDNRTGRRAGIACYLTREQAERQIQTWRDRDARGGRPDIHDLIPFLAPAQEDER